MSYEHARASYLPLPRHKWGSVKPRPEHSRPVDLLPIIAGYRSCPVLFPPIRDDRYSPSVARRITCQQGSKYLIDVVQQKAVMMKERINPTISVQLQDCPSSCNRSFSATDRPTDGLTACLPITRPVMLPRSVGALSMQPLPKDTRTLILLPHPDYAGSRKPFTYHAVYLTCLLHNSHRRRGWFHLLLALNLEQSSHQGRGRVGQTGWRSESQARSFHDKSHVPHNLLGQVLV